MIVLSRENIFKMFWKGLITRKTASFLTTLCYSLTCELPTFLSASPVSQALSVREISSKDQLQGRQVGKSSERIEIVKLFVLVMGPLKSFLSTRLY